MCGRLEANAASTFLPPQSLLDGSSVHWSKPKRKGSQTNFIITTSKYNIKIYDKEIIYLFHYSILLFSQELCMYTCSLVSSLCWSWTIYTVTTQDYQAQEDQRFRLKLSDFRTNIVYPRDLQCLNPLELKSNLFILILGHIYIASHLLYIHSNHLLNHDLKILENYMLVSFY